MPNGWLPQDGSELVPWINQQLRILNRHRHIQYVGEIPGSIDASGGEDTFPPISYIEGVDDDQPLPTAPVPGTPPPSDTEEGDPGDAFSGGFVDTDGERPIASMRVYGNSGTVKINSGGSFLDISTLVYGDMADPYINTPGESTISFDSWVSIVGNEIIVAQGWYNPIMWLMLEWASEAASPPAFGPFLTGPNGIMANDYDIRPRCAISSTKWGLYAIRDFGRVYVEPDVAGLSLFPDCYVPVTSATASTTGRVGWLIHKLS